MKKVFLISFLLLFLFLGFSQVQAAGLVPCGGPEEDPCQLCHFFVMTNNAVKFLTFGLVPVLAALMLVVGGIMFFFAGARPNFLRQAKEIITSVLIGLLIVFSAWVVINTIFVKADIIKMEGWQWWRIDCHY